jgi:hypothetical protein
LVVSKMQSETRALRCDRLVVCEPGIVYHPEADFVARPAWDRSQRSVRRTLGDRPGRHALGDGRLEAGSDNACSKMTGALQS